MTTIPSAHDRQNAGEVFISYRWEDDAHCGRVHDLANRLEAEGFRVIFDVFAKTREFYGGAPPRGWDHWSVLMATRAASVVVIASAGWFRVLNESEPIETGLGAAAEAETVFHRLYRRNGFNDFCSIGYFDPTRDLATLPPYLDKCDRVHLTDAAQIASLYQWLRRPKSKLLGSQSGPARLFRSDGSHVPFELPPAAMNFFGRQTQREQLTARLRAGQSTVVVGPAGIGKTALAADALVEVVG